MPVSNFTPTAADVRSGARVPGNYRVTIVAFAQHEHPSGTRYLLVTCKLSRLPGEKVAPKVMIPLMQSQTACAILSVRRFLLALGYTNSQLKDSISFDAESLIGKRPMITIKKPTVR